MPTLFDFVLAGLIGLAVYVCVYQFLEKWEEK